MIYQDAPYYLAPDGKMAEETFIVLREAMREADKLAIARLVLSSRERMVTIGARDKGMFVSTLRAPNEVRATSTYFDEIPDEKPDAEMLEMAEALIAQKTTKFDPKQYEDRYETALMAMIKEKLKGHKPIIAAAPERGNVVNLMDALKASLGQAKPAAPSKSKARGGCAGREAGQGGERRDAAEFGQGEVVRPLAGAAVGLVGALATLPRRIAAREVARHGGELHRGLTRRTTVVVFGRKLLAREDAAGIEARVAAARGAGRGAAQRGRLPAAARSGRGPRRGSPAPRCWRSPASPASSSSCLALFDAFERDVEPFSFRDLILARKYAGLVAGGADWAAIARSVHRFGPAVSLTAKSLQARRGPGDLRLSSGRGQRARRPAAARARGAGGRGRGGPVRPRPRRRRRRGDTPRRRRSSGAASRSIRTMRWRPSTGRTACARPGARPRPRPSTRGRCGSTPGSSRPGSTSPACSRRSAGATSARRHLARAIALDAGYADAVFNLATLAFEAGDLAEARRLWERYLELDPDSEWARRAARGVQFVDLRARGFAG